MNGAVASRANGMLRALAGGAQGLSMGNTAII